MEGERLYIDVEVMVWYNRNGFERKALKKRL